MTTTPGIDRHLLTMTAYQRLQGVTGASAWLGEPDVEPLPQIPDSDGRVKPYTILWPGAGTPTLELDAADTAVDLEWTIQITCAAGYPEDLVALVGRVDAAFYRWIPSLTGLVCDRFRPPPGYDPGPIRLDRDVTPHRPWLPLQYRTTITAT